VTYKAQPSENGIAGKFSNFVSFDFHAVKRVENDARNGFMYKRLSMPNLLYWLASTIGTLKVCCHRDYQLGNLQQMLPP
jgi:hypothetical protein